jgi:DNA gyrase subunit A
LTASTPGPSFDITSVTIEEEMKRSYLDYAMSVIVARALPDVRDGLKPVHRRILFAMKEGGYDWNRPLRKAARVVGDVMGKYHPHGDSAIYEAMVRMAQDFSMRLPLIQGQGNFGSMDGDPPAAMRYTEVRLARAATALLDDIDKETVDFQPNYDDSAVEPTVLPARFPNLLVNGAGGIAVGMATNIPTHNLGEVVDACCALIDDPAISIDRLMEIVPGPDFPTGGIILGRAGIREAYHFGRGSIAMRGKAHIEDIRKDRAAIVVTEVPYQVNKARMLERIAEIVQEKLIDGIADLRDESDRDGVRVVVELKRDAVPEVVLNQLYRYTVLQTSFGVNMLALIGGRPQMMTLKDVLAAFIAFREEVITRRTVFELKKARERAHLLVGLAIAVANIDRVIAIIRGSPDPNAARERLMAESWPGRDVETLIRLIDEPGRTIADDGHYRLSEAQARGILELRLQRLTGLERDKIGDELGQLATEIREHLDVLGSRPKLLGILQGELIEIKEGFATPRRTTIEDIEFETDIEDLIQREDMVVTVSHSGYIKRVPLSAYRAQRRGGKGRAGMATREEDFVSQVFVANTHTPMLFFSSRGMVYQLKVYRLPLGTPQARGKALVNLLPLAEGETISTVMPLPGEEEGGAARSVMFATASGGVRRNSLGDFTNIKANGKIAMKLDEGDQLIAVKPCLEQDDVLLATRLGKAIRFQASDVRLFQGRTSTGVRGIALGEGDGVISMSILRHVDASAEEREVYLRWAGARRRAVTGEGEPPPDPGIPPARLAELEAAEEFILSIADDGFGKRSSAFEYRITSRGGKGIDNMDLARGSGREAGEVVAAFPVGHQDQVVLVTDGGQLIRLPIDDVRIAGRTTRGVTLFRVAEGERVVSVTRLEDVGGEGNGEGATNGADIVAGNGADGAALPAGGDGPGEAGIDADGAADE